MTEQEQIDLVLDEIAKELDVAIRRFSPMASAHEGYAVVLEEMDELWTEIKQGRPTRARQEAIQVAAMAVRFLVDLYAAEGKEK